MRKQSAGRDYRVLIVEDEPAQAELYAAILTPAFFVETVPTYAAAETRIKDAAQPAIDGVLFDLCLPNGVGVELVRRFQWSAPQVPMVVVTGMADVNPLSAIEAGAQDFLRKPVDADQLLATMAHAIARHKVRGEFKHEKRLVEEMRKENESLTATRADLLAALPIGSPRPPSPPPPLPPSPGGDL